LTQTQNPRTLLGFLGSLGLNGLSLVLSLGAHGAAVGGWVAWDRLLAPTETPGDGGEEDGPVGNGGGDVGPTALQTPAAPVNVAMYQPPATPAPAPSETAAPAPRPKPKPSEAKPTEAGATASTTATETGDGTSTQEGVAGSAPRGARKPCEPTDQVTQLADTRWRVERELVDWYARHPLELEKQAGVGVHKGADGKPDGAKIFLPRCSILRHGGLKSGDIIRSVNGETITTIAGAIKLYLKLRNAETIKVELTRKDGTERSHVYKLK